MFSQKFLVLLVGSQVAADKIEPDWKVLTDFTATYQFDAKNLLKAGAELGVHSAEGSGTIKFDLDGERLEIHADNEAKPRGPPVTVRAAGTLAFDPKAGYIGIKARGSARGFTKGRIEFCVTVSFPKGLMPPAQMFEQKLDMYKPMIKQQLNALPSTEMTIDGEEVEIIKVPFPHSEPDYDGPLGSECEGYENCETGWRCQRPTDAIGVCQICQPGQDDCNNGPKCEGSENCVPGWRCERPTDAIGTCQICQMSEHAIGTFQQDDCNSGGVRWLVRASPPPFLYVGLRPNAAPFGAGITAPKGDTWNPVLKFPTWQHGAGSIEEFSCTDMPEASTSAAELVADPEASKTLKVFEELLTSLHGIQPLNKAFGSVPARPWTIFHDAAAKELITKANAMNNSQQQWPSVALAGAAGALGGVAMLFALLKLTARRSLRTEPLLEQFA